MEEHGVEIEWNPNSEAFRQLVGGVYDIFNELAGSYEVLTMVQDYVAALK